MRVAIDTNGLYAGQAGGARYIRGLLKGLKSIAPNLDWYPFAWEVENLGYRQPMRGIKTLYREIVWGKMVAPGKLASHSTDLYHATGSYFVHPPRNVRRVVTLYDLAALRHPERFRWWHRTSERRRLRRLASVDRVLCISQFTADEAMQLLGLPARLMEVTYCGCDFLDQTGGVQEQKPDLEVPPAFFLFVGSLEPGKNLALIRQAYELAASRGQTLPPLLVVGVRREGVGSEGQPPPGWHYLGRQPDGVLVHLYRRALALVFPSKYEGFGLPLVEAMALGCPVICSRVASLPEVGGKAVYWSNLNAADYLAALQEIARNDRLRDELIRSGRDQAAKFTWERCAQQVVEVYRDVLKSSS